MIFVRMKLYSASVLFAVSVVILAQLVPWSSSPQGLSLNAPVVSPAIYGSQVFN